MKARPAKKDTNFNQTQQQSRPSNQANQRSNNQRPFNKQQSKSGSGMGRGPVARPTGSRPYSKQRQMVKPEKPKGPITNVKSVQLPPSMTVKDFSQLIEVAAGSY